MPSERTREGQTHRYFQPWKDLQAANDRLSVDISSQDAPRSSQDRALTAFAQLATLRLGVKRAMVSLIDAKTQYILAEATQTVSLVDTTKHSENDEVWMGSSSIDRFLAVCHSTFDSKYTVKNEDGTTSTHNALVVEDMRQDPRFKDREYVKNGSVLFYAGVPIRTRTGIRIGVYAVSNMEPRRGLDARELSFMQDVAAAVMEHLELSKNRNDSIRGERMVRGLTSFIEGYSSVDEAADKDVQMMSVGRADIYSGDEAPKRHRNRASDPQVNKKSEMSRLFHRAAKIIREATLADGVVFLDATSQIIPTGPGDNNESGDSNVETFQETDASGPEREGRVSFKLTRPIKTRSIGAESNPDLSDKKSASDSDASPTRQATCEVLGIDVLQNDMNLNSSTARFPLAKKDLKRCIQRYPNGKIFSMFEDSTTSSGDDTTSDAERVRQATATSRTRRKKHGLRRTMADDILRQLPGVTSVLFLPLWDTSGERWLSGMFLWTTQIGRLTDAEDELPYLKAFANSITSDFARINALFSERAKTTFIASISHELRSPLHGILGSIEFLHDTSIDSYQSSLISQVETCGRTLLDTISHVLDYSKINDLGVTKDTGGNGKNQSRSSSGKDVSLTLVAEFDLSVLVEEVTEAIFAGRIFNRQRQAERIKSSGIKKLLPRTQSEPSTVGESEGVKSQDVIDQPHNVAVILSINKEDNWNVRAQPGALRRVIMNLLGNALKYTDHGFVEVSLKSKRDSKQFSRLAVELRFVDSGKGMSDEYQRDRLYRPFSQEDPFTEGTGLGLSIVRQIVESLKGKIKIKSQQGVGTEVTVSFSLPRAKSDQEEEPDTFELSQNVLQATRGTKIALIDPTAPDKNTERTREAARRMQSTVRELCEEWFGAEVTQSPEFEDGQAALAIFTDAPSVEYILGTLITRDSSETATPTPIIIMCPNAYDSVALKRQIPSSGPGGRRIHVIAQPCGPRKLAKALELCLVTRPSLSRKSSRNPESSMSITSTTSSSSGVGHPVMTEKLPLLSPAAISATSVSEPSTPPSALAAREELTKKLLLAGPMPLQQPPKPVEGLPMPIRDAKPTLASPDTTTARIPNILLVDDNKINLQLLVTFMKKAKFQYTPASDGLEALNAYKAAADAILSPSSPTPTRPIFDFILMDLSMPIMDGLTSTREIRKVEKERRLKPAKIFALTGLASASAQEEAFASGVDHFLPKPVNFKELRGLLQMIDEEQDGREKERQRRRSSNIVEVAQLGE